MSSYAQVNGRYTGIDIFTGQGERDNGFTLLNTQKGNLMRFLIAIALIATLAACIPNNPVKMSMTANPLPNTPEVVATGKAIFERNCQMCHGSEGRGDGAAAQALATKPANLRLLNNKPEGLIAMRIIGGGSVMPAWKNILTEEEIWQLSRYIKTISQEEAQIVAKK